MKKRGVAGLIVIALFLVLLASSVFAQDLPTPDSLVFETEDILVFTGNSQISSYDQLDTCTGGAPGRGTFLQLPQFQNRHEIEGKFTISKTGTYAVWNRWFTSSNGGSPRYRVYIDGVHYRDASDDFRDIRDLCGGWKRVDQFYFEAGEHTIEFACDGPCTTGVSDQLLITDDLSYVPTEIFKETVSPPPNPDESEQVCRDGGGDWQNESVDNPCCIDGSDMGYMATDSFGKELICYQKNGVFNWALAGQLDFKIIQVGDQDVISNKEEFFFCNASEVGKGIPPPGFAVQDDIRRAGKFICTQRGDEYQFLECCDPQASGSDSIACDNPGARSRPPGEHIASFQDFIIPSPFSFTFSGETKIFNSEIKNWDAYGYLVFYLQTSKDIDIDIELTDEQGARIFRDALINYAVTSPRSGKWVKFMIPAIPKVRHNQIHFINTHEVISGEDYRNDVTISNMHLQSSSSDDLFCSGATYVGGSVEKLWINDLDLNSPDRNGIPVGKPACEENDALTWTGSACCGDDNNPQSNEYYNDPQGGVCWNGDALAEDTPAMDVEFGLDYTVVDYELDDQNYSFSLSWDEREEDTQTLSSSSGYQSTYCGSSSGCGHRLLVAFDLACPQGYDILDAQFIHGGDSAPSMSVSNRTADTNAGASFACWSHSLDDGDRSRCSMDGTITCYNTWPERKNYYSPLSIIQPNPGEDFLGKLSGFVGSPYLWDDPYEGDNNTWVFPDKHGLIQEVSVDQPENTNIKIIFNQSGRDNSSNFNEDVVAKIVYYVTKPVPRSEHKDATYLCTDGQCDFISPQPPLFNVSNKHPDLYDFSYLRADQTRLLSSQSQSFSKSGVLRASRISNQVIATQGQLGLCTPADYVVNKVGESNIQPLCGIIGSYFCSGIGWSNEGSGGLTPVERDKPKSIFLGRNLLRNPSFTDSEGGVPLFWSLTQGTDTDQVRVFDTVDIQTDTVRLFDDLALEEVGIKSDPVRVSSDTLYTLSADVLCNNTGNSLSLAAQLYDGDSLLSQTSSASSSIHLWERVALEFNSSTASHVVTMIKVGSNKGECFVDNVMLQKGSDDNPLYHDYVAGVVSQSCCNVDSCWDGAQCTPDVSADALSEPIHENRCVRGDWVMTPRVTGVDGVKEGFCPSASECLVNLEGMGSTPGDWYTGNTPLCIGDNEFFEDNLCDNGRWASRTRTLALALLELVNKTGDTQDYTLYCDNFDKALVDVEYSNIEDTILGPLSQGALATKSCFDDISAPCANNFCVLQFTDKFDGEERRVVATSLNKPIDDRRDSFLSAIDRPVNFCDNAQGQAGFAKCSTDDKLWYSSEVNALITSQGAVNFEGPSGTEQFFYVLRNPIQSLISWIVGAQQGVLQQDVAFAERTNRFDRLFIDVDGEKRINGVIEKVGADEFVLVSYKNYSIDVCSYVNAAARTQGIGLGAQISDITCEKEGDVYNVFTDSRTDLWQQFILPGRGTVQTQSGPLN